MSSSFCAMVSEPDEVAILRGLEDNTGKAGTARNSSGMGVERKYHSAILESGIWECLRF